MTTESSCFKKPDVEQLRKQLSEEQFHVTQNDGTERPFHNEYWNNHRKGIYVDIVSGEPLFCSENKFDSGTGWPSFDRPLEPCNIQYREDRKLLSKRVEVRSTIGESHLGHVFDDGPTETGKRYCINSASLRFIPEEEMADAGYGEYLELFEPR